MFYKLYDKYIVVGVVAVIILYSPVIYAPSSELPERTSGIPVRDTKGVSCGTEICGRLCLLWLVWR